MSPRLSSRLSLLLRSERYRRLDSRPAIRSRTDFFAAASTVTRVLAYSGATPFLTALSGALERVNVSRAQLICGSCAPGSPASPGWGARSNSPRDPIGSCSVCRSRAARGSRWLGSPASAEPLDVLIIQPAASPPA